MRDDASTAMQRWVRVLGVLALLATSVVLRDLIVPVLIALVIASLLAPGVKRLQTMHVPSAVGALLGVVLVALLGVAALSLAADPFTGLIDRVPKLFAVVKQTWQQTFGRLPLQAPDAAPLDFGTAWNTASWILAHVNGALVTAGMSLIVAYFMLVHGEVLGQAVMRAIATSGRFRAKRIYAAARLALQRYFATIAIINLFFGLSVGLALATLGVEHAFLLGALAGLFNFVPFLGAVVMMIAITLLALAQHGGSASASVAPLVFFGLHLVESQFVTPWITGQRLKVNPLIVVMTLVLAFILWGLGGVFLAVPMLTTLKSACDASPQLARWGALLGPGSARLARRRPKAVTGAGLRAIRARAARSLGGTT